MAGRRLLVYVWAPLLVAGFRATVQAQGSDSTLAKISRLASTGDRQGAHLLADSLLAITGAATPTYSEALYWRAFTAANAAEAERDYLRLAIEYPLAARSEDALLLLSQLEFARGDRSSALRHLERLVRDHPSGRNVGRASFWTARIAFETGDSQRACDALALARVQLAAEDVETRNQVEYYAPRCVVGPSSRPDSASAATPPSATTRGPEYSLQVAAFKTKREAQALATRLKSRGFEARVTHVDMWYRVRIGRYQRRGDAEAAEARVKKSKITARIVEAEPR